jgi:hypothetical protein
MNSGWCHSVRNNKQPNGKYNIKYVIKLGRGKITKPLFLLMPIKICPNLKLEENSGSNRLIKNILI